MGKSQSVRSGDRLFEVDAVKFFAIIYMILIHVYERFGKFDFDHTMPDSVYRNLMEFFGGPLAAPVFMFCMGIGMIYTRHDSPSQFIRRGFKLLLTGYALNFFRQTLPMLIGMAMGIETEFSLIGGLLNVDILPFAGMAFMTIGLMKKFKIPSWGMCGIAVVLQAIGIWATKLKIASVGLATFIGLLIPSGDHVAFPMTLWLIYPVLGMIFAERLKKTSDRRKLYKDLMIASAVAFVGYTVALIYIGYDIRLIYALYELSYYDQTILSTLWITPLMIIAMGSCYFLFGGLEKNTIGKFIRHCSVNLNTIYIIQWILIAYVFAFSVLFGAELTASPLILTLIGLSILTASILIMTLYRKIRRSK